MTASSQLVRGQSRSIRQRASGAGQCKSILAALLRPSFANAARASGEERMERSVLPNSLFPLCYSPQARKAERRQTHVS